MGARVSEPLAEHCGPTYNDSCPQTCQSSEVIKRQELLAKRKKESISYGLRQKRLAEHAGITTQPNEIMLIGGRFLSGEMTLEELRGTVLGTKRASQAKDDLSVQQALKRVARENMDPNEDLQQSATRGSLRHVQRALDNGAELTTANARGVTCVMLACSSSGKEAREIVEYLVSRQADVHKTDSQGWTCLHHACRNGKTEIAKILISMKVDPTNKATDQATPLMLAAIEGKYDLVKELFYFKNVREQIADKDISGATCLHYAVKDGHVDVTKLLLEYNAKVNAKDKDGKTPIFWACETGKLECVKHLFKKHADVDAKDAVRKTPLLYACMNNYEILALWLIKKVADPLHKDKEGMSAIILASENGMTKNKFKVESAFHAEED